MLAMSAAEKKIVKLGCMLEWVSIAIGRFSELEIGYVFHTPADLL